MAAFTIKMRDKTRYAFTKTVIVLLSLYLLRKRRDISPGLNILPISQKLSSSALTINRDRTNWAIKIATILMRIRLMIISITTF